MSGDVLFVKNKDLPVEACRGDAFGAVAAQGGDAARGAEHTLRFKDNEFSLGALVGLPHAGGQRDVAFCHNDFDVVFINVFALNFEGAKIVYYVVLQGIVI